VELTGGVHESVIEGEGKRTGSGGALLGCGLVAVLGRKGFPGSSFTFLFPLFSFSFSVFLISFLDFAFVTQMTSNQFVKFSKNQRNKLGQ
jgi:hypothetical protein